MLLRWDPFRELDRLSDQMLRNDVGPMRIPMDAVRTGDRVEIHFELPGIDPDDVTVDVDRNVLSVNAERTVSEERKEGEEVLVRERRHGRFMRQVTLGDNLDAERLEARYHDGILTISVPVVEQAKSRRIEIARRTSDEGSAAIETSSQPADREDDPDDGRTHAA
jgi:HSP20 family protein